MMNRLNELWMWFVAILFTLILAVTALGMVAVLAYPVIMLLGWGG